LLLALDLDMWSIFTGWSIITCEAVCELFEDDAEFLAFADAEREIEGQESNECLVAWRSARWERDVGYSASRGRNGVCIHNAEFVREIHLVGELDDVAGLHDG